MHFIVDAQLPLLLCRWLKERGFDAEHVADMLGGRTPDATIAHHAERTGAVLITKDDDFAFRHPPVRYQLVWLRCGNTSNRALHMWLERRWAALHQKLAAGERFIEVR